MQPLPPSSKNGYCNFLVIDDMIQTPIFRKGNNAFTNLVLKNRNICGTKSGLNILILTQSLKEIPKTIRINTNVFCIFKFASKKVIIDDLYTEVSNLCSEEDFESLLDHATKGEHNCLTIDFTQDEENRFKFR